MPDTGVASDANASDAETPLDAATDATANADASHDAGSTSDSRCPAYPAMPDAACTGVLPDTTPTVCDGHITTTDASYTDCLFPDGIVINANVKNVQITNSKI